MNILIRCKPKIGREKKIKSPYKYMKSKIRLVYTAGNDKNESQ